MSSCVFVCVCLRIVISNIMWLIFLVFCVLFFALFVFGYPVLSVSLDCPLLVAPLVFSGVCSLIVMSYLHLHIVRSTLDIHAFITPRLASCYLLNEINFPDYSSSEIMSCDCIKYICPLTNSWNRVI